jgi:uncharacterized protein (DUF952 family)
MTVVFHLLPRDQWDGVAADDVVAPPSLTSEGFVHCTDDLEQLLAVANAFYAAQPGAYVVLHIDVERLGVACRWEPPVHPDGSATRPDEAFLPHVYGPIPRAAVVAEQVIERDAAGRFVGYGAPTRP